MSMQERLKSLRKEIGLTQAEMAKKVGVTSSAYGFWERGRNEPDLKMIAKLAEIFDVSTDYLLGRTSDRHRPYYELTAKDHKEIDNYIDNIETDLSAGLLLDGEPIDADALATLRENIRFAAEIAKREAKRKHTPKKYRD